MKVGLIGCGHAASLHAEIYQSMDDLRIVAIADNDYPKANFFAHKYAIDRVVSDYNEILEDEEIDFVDICTPTSTHAKIACDAAKSSHHILLEKPMAMSVEECNSIIDESRKNRVKICLVHNFLFLPAVRLLKQMVDTGRYDVTSLRTSYKIPKNQGQYPKWVLTAEEKGLLWELGYHLAYLQLEFLKDIREVHGWGQKLKFPVYDKIGAFLSTPNSSYGVFELSTISKQREFVVEMDSSDGSRVKIDVDRNTYAEIPETQKNRGNKFLSCIQALVEGNIPRRSKTRLGYSIGHFQLIREFAKNLQHDTPQPVQPEEGREAVRLLTRIEKCITKNSG